MAKRSDLIFSRATTTTRRVEFSFVQRMFEAKTISCHTYLLYRYELSHLRPKLVAPMSSFLFDLTIGMTGRGLTLRKPSCILPC